MVGRAALASLSVDVESLASAAHDSGQDMVAFMLSSFVQTLAQLQADWDLYRAEGDDGE